MELGQKCSGKTQQVTLEGQSCNRADVISGVFQGADMGSLLFLAFINELPEYTSSDVRLFANHCLLCRKTNSTAGIRQLQQNTASLEYWDRERQMEFHLMTCAATHKHQIPHPLTLESVSSVNYLAVTLNNMMNLTKHIRTIRGKSWTTPRFLRSNLQGYRADVKPTAYSTMVTDPPWCIQLHHGIPSNSFKHNSWTVIRDEHQCMPRAITMKEHYTM